jgi:lipopolysaccharide/colanic/teichoic acid biosynthesis glycosyltransferase
VKPGISGLAQVNNIDMSDPARLASWDARYISLQSLAIDVKITLQTVQGGGQGDKTSA